MVKIRLARAGSKNRPKYRIVAADERFKRDGRFLEIIGHYDSSSSDNNFEINNERVKYWLSVGAKPTETVRHLLNRS